MGAESTDGYETDVTNAQRAFVAGAVARLTSTRQRYTVQCCTYLLLTVLTYYDYNEPNRLSILTVHDIIPALSQCMKSPRHSHSASSHPSTLTVHQSLQ